jgi:hypothetical protein
MVGRVRVEQSGEATAVRRIVSPTTGEPLVWVDLDVNVITRIFS